MMFGSFRDLAFMGAALEAPPAPGLDPDAAAYIAAVEDTDGQALEAAVVDAIDAFVVGCKADGIWNAIKASCILAGARTLAGALVPLAGTAPTSFNFVDGDYNRKTGLVGNESTKYLNANRNATADPQNSRHFSVYASNVSTGSAQTFIAARTTGGSGNAYMDRNSNSFRLVNNGVGVAIGISFAAGMYGSSSAHRIAFYSIGESLDLALLDARVTALINAFDTAIPS
jgi:hypothetical protein